MSTLTGMNALARVEAALRDHGCRGGRGGWTCPSHEDRSPSLSVRAGGGGRVLVHCHAGCETAEVVGAIGLTMVDLFDDDRRGRPRREGRPTGAHRPASDYRARIGLPTWDDWFWCQPAAFIDAHLVRLETVAPAPDDDALAAWLAERHERARRG